MTEYPDEDQEKRIEKLREEIGKLGGRFSTDVDCPADLEEEFLRHVLEYEHSQPIALLQILTNAGLDVPAPNDLEDSALSEKLWEVIQRMATMGAYLLHTDHLSDRELYTYLYSDGLIEEATLFPENPNYAYMIDLTGSGSEEDNQLYFKYYADDEYRVQWARDWPEDHIPPREQPPYTRDIKLPRSPLDTLEN
jgi:hypothetical protein